jgi:SAM-dependent methyltransferase
MMGYVKIQHPHENQNLQVLWKLMQCYGSNDAAMRFCEKYECIMGVNRGAWKFFFPTPEKGNILELGGGFGSDTVDLAKQATGIISIVPNITNALIIDKHLREKNITNAEIAVVKDIARLPFPDHSIAAIAMEDAAAPGFAMTHRNFSCAAAEWRRVLAPGGVVFLGLGNPFERLLGLHFIRSRFHARSDPESLNRYVKKASGRPQWAVFGLRRTIRCMIQLGFDAPSIFSPLPDEKKCEVVLPVEDPRAIHYFLNKLIRKNSPAIRAVILASNILLKLKLLHPFLPYYFLTFRLTDGKESGRHSN